MTYARGKHPNIRLNRSTVVDLLLVELVGGQWCYRPYTRPARIVLTKRQRKFLQILSRCDGMERGTMSAISTQMGMQPKSVWSITAILRRKFGLGSRFDLLPIAKQLAKNGTRRRPSNRQPVSGELVNGVIAIDALHEVNSGPEALQPGAAPRRVLLSNNRSDDDGR